MTPVSAFASPVRRPVARLLLGVAMFVPFLVAGAGCTDLPAKPARYVTVLTAEHGSLNLPPPARRVPEDKGMLLGPNFGIRAEQVSAVESLSDDDAKGLGLDEPFRAADGHELLLLEVAAVDRWAEGRWDEKGQTPKAKVVVGAYEKRLTEVPGPGSVVVVSVPKRKAARLTVTDRGRAQSMNIRTGQRADDAFGPAPYQRLDETYDDTGSVRGPRSSRSLDIRIRMSATALEPYFPGLGWARSGRGWLLLDLAQVHSDGLARADVADPVVGFFLDPAKTFRLSWAGGRAHARGGRAFNTLEPVKRYVAVFDVPSSFRTGTLAVAPDGPLFTFRGTSSIAELTRLGEVPDCRENERLQCLAWRDEPGRQRVRIRLD